MTNSEYRALISKLIERTSARKDAKALSDAFELVKAYDEQVRLDVFDAAGSQVQISELSGEAADSHSYSQRIRRLAEGMLADGQSDYVSTLLDIVQESLFFDSPYDFDAFCRYVESEREERNQFYMPRRKQLSLLRFTRKTGGDTPLLREASTADWVIFCVLTVAKKLRTRRMQKKKIPLRIYRCKIFNLYQSSP